MPDLATALKNAIDNATINKEKEMTYVSQPDAMDLKTLADRWAKDDPVENKAPQGGWKPFEITNNVTRATFACIRDNPGKTPAEIWHLLEPHGYKRDSVATLISQMTKVGMVEKGEGNKLRTLVPEYTKISVKDLQTVRAKEKKEKRALVRMQTKEIKAAIAKLPHILPKDTVKITVKKASEGIAALAKKEAVVETKLAQSFDADTLLSTLSFKDAITLYKKLKAMLGEV